MWFRSGSATCLKALFDAGLNQFYHRSVVLPFEILFHYLLIVFSSLADTYTRISLLIKGAYKKEARVSNSSLIPRIRPSHCPFVKDKQCRSPRRRVYIRTMYIAPLDIGSCFTVRQRFQICEVRYAADKTSSSTSFLLCPVSHPLTSQGFGWLTLQRYDFFLTRQVFFASAYFNILKFDKYFSSKTHGTQNTNLLLPYTASYRFVPIPSDLEGSLPLLRVENNR